MKAPALKKSPTAATVQTKTATATATASPQANIQSVSFGSVGHQKRGHRVLIYGTGGIGKTTLACTAPSDVVYIDGEESLEILKDQFEAQGIKSPLTIPSITGFKTLRFALASQGWNSVRTICLEAGILEKWATAYTIENVTGKGGQKMRNIEEYGYGAGFRHVYDAFLLLLNDFDRHARAGRNVILIAHECVKKVPNPSGNDWIRYEPRLQDSDKASIRMAVKEWSDHTLFYSYDVTTKEDDERKAIGRGSRAIYTSELPHFMAKSRTTSETIFVESPNSDVWSKIIK